MKRACDDLTVHELIVAANLCEKEGQHTTALRLRSLMLKTLETEFEDKPRQEVPR